MSDPKYVHQLMSDDYIVEELIAELRETSLERVAFTESQDPTVFTLFNSPAFLSMEIFE